MTQVYLFNSQRELWDHDKFKTIKNYETPLWIDLMLKVEIKKKEAKSIKLVCNLTKIKNYKIIIKL